MDENTTTKPADVLPIHRAGDEIIFKYEGNLRGTVERVRFNGCKATYEVSASFTFEVPQSFVVGADGEGVR